MSGLRFTTITTSPSRREWPRLNRSCLARGVPPAYLSVMDLADFRKEYSNRGLRREQLDADPVAQFATWFTQATELGLHEPNAMILATTDASGMPYQRTVLLKSFDQTGFVFFSNYESRKARQMVKNPHVSLLFPWITLERQVCIQGVVEKISAADSLKYFLSRPRESQLGAWVSNQSEVIPSREFLLGRLAEIEEKFSQGEIPLPPFWGGYRVKPQRLEFWQGGPARLHDRFLYHQENGGWQMDRLSP
jgi:pyridoxamine 5'-phosphate oxidase